MKKELIHIIREYLRLKHKVDYKYDDVIGDIDSTVDPDTKLQIITDLSSDFSFPDDVIKTLDTNTTKKQISDIQIQIKKFAAKKKDLDDDVPALKNRVQGEPFDEEKGEMVLPEGDLDIPKFDDIKANIIQIISLLGKIDL